MHLKIPIYGEFRTDMSPVQVFSTEYDIPVPWTVQRTVLINNYVMLAMLQVKLLKTRRMKNNCHTRLQTKKAID
jgi:hypothetical protein